MQKHSLTIARHVMTQSMSSKHDYKWKQNTETESRNGFTIQVTQEQRGVGSPIPLNNSILPHHWGMRIGTHTHNNHCKPKQNWNSCFSFYWQNRILERWEKRKVLCRRGGLEVCFCSLHIHFARVFSNKTSENSPTMCFRSTWPASAELPPLSVN